jgi:hypothetical protein
MKKPLSYLFSFTLLLSSTLYLVPAASAQTWTMDRYNPSRTNQGSLIGPRNLPNFVTVNNSINGSLIRSGPDGSIITWNPLIGSTGFGQIHRYLLNGSMSWDSSIPTDGLGLKDVAVNQDGTVYVISMGQVVALNKATGNQTWTFQGSNPTSPLAIGRQGTIYFHSGAAFFGGSETITAIAPDGTPLWQAIGTFRGDTKMVFSTDESTVYLLNTKSIFGSPIGNVTSYSTTEGHKISDTPCDPRGMLFAYAPWDVLYSFATDGAFFLGLSPDLSSCALVSANGLSTVDMAAATRQGRILVQSLNSITIMDQSGNILFNSNEPLVNGFVDSAGVLFAENPQTNEIVVIDTVSLSQLWRSSIKDPITGFSLGSDGNLYVSAGTALLKSAPVQQPVWPMTGHDPQRTGLSTFAGPTAPPPSPSWTFTSGGPVIGDLAVSAEGRIYFSSDKLYALNPDGTTYAPAVALVPLTAPAIDDLNGFVYVIAVSDSRNYYVLRYSKQLQTPAVVYHGAFSFVTPTSITVGPDGTVYFSDGVSLIAVGPHSWRTQDRPCFGSPGFLAPTLGRDGSVYSMCNSGGGIGFGSGIYRYDGDTGVQIASTGYSRGGTELIIDAQNDIRAGFQAFDGATFGGAYDAWDANLIKLTPGNNGDFTTSRSALFPDGFSTARMGFSFQSTALEASGAHDWGVIAGPQAIPNFSSVPTIDASGNVFVGTVSGVAALNGIDGSTLWFGSLADTITTQPAISASGALFIGSSSGKVYAFDSKPTTGTIVVSTNNAAATFTIAGPVTYLGNGTSFTQTNAPPGTYTITYGGVPCYTTPQSETLTLDAGGTIHFGTANLNGGIYSGSTTLSVNITPSAAAASFSISPSVQGLNTAGPYPVTVTSAVPQSYTVTFNDVSGFITPSPQTASPSNLCSIYFSGNYVPLAASTAQLSIALNTDKGGFTISSLTDPSGFKTISALNKQAALFGPISLPIGDYKIRFAAVTGYYPPAVQTFTLTAGANLSIRGLYQRLFFIGFTGFTNAPHDSPSTVDCVFGHKRGNGIQFVRPEAGAGITQIVPEIEGDLGSPALQPGLRGASFAFYGTLDGKQQDGDACTPPILPPDRSVHYEAEQWLKGQHPTVWDKVVIAGHSYGGNRARLFSEQIQKDLQLNTDLLITVDAVDWTKCSLASVLFTGDSFGDAARNCTQASFAAGAIPPTRALSAYSFFQTAGIHVAGGDFPFPTGYIVPHAQSQLVNNAFHDTIDDQPDVHGKIRDLMLNVIRQDTVVVEAGDLSRNLTTLIFPINLSVTGLGEAHNIIISHATLANTSAVNLADGSSIGDIPSGASKAITFYFPVVTSGTAVDIAISGTYDNGRTFSSMIHSTVP